MAGIDKQDGESEHIQLELSTLENRMQGFEAPPNPLAMAAAWHYQLKGRQRTNGLSKRWLPDWPSDSALGIRRNS